MIAAVAAIALPRRYLSRSGCSHGHGPTADLVLGSRVPSTREHCRAVAVAVAAASGLQTAK